MPIQPHLNHLIAALHRRRWPAAVASGALLALAFPSHPDHPLAWLFAPLWGHLALVPLLCTLKGRGFKGGFANGWVAGAVWNLLCLYWVAHTQGGGPAVVAGTALMAAYLGLFPGLCTGLLAALGARWGHRALWLAPALWTGQEYLLSLGELGFPWLLLGHGQAAWPRLIQHASWTGVFGVTFWVVGLNVLIYLALTAQRPRLLAPIALCYALPLLHAQFAIAAQPAQHIRVGLIQPNITLEQKWGPRGLENSFAALEHLSRQAAADEPALLVWPETALPCNLARRADCRDRAFALVEELGTPLLTGASDYNLALNEPYNAAFFLTPGTVAMPAYAKMHLVPFGERTPYRDDIPLLRDIDWTQLTGDLGPAEFARGTRRTIFDHPDAPFSVLICFESIFPDLVRRHVAAGAQILVNITNDSWFGRSAGPYQHALINAMRAVENRTAVARAATSGVTLFIDPYGRQRQATELFVPAAAVSDVAVARETTFYTRYGDLFAQGCLALSLAALIPLYRQVS